MWKLISGPQVGFLTGARANIAEFRTNPSLVTWEAGTSGHRHEKERQECTPRMTSGPGLDRDRYGDETSVAELDDGAKPEEQKFLEKQLPLSQDDMVWTPDHVHDTCEPKDDDLRHAITQCDYDQNSWDKLDLELVRAGESGNRSRPDKCGGNGYVDRYVAMGDLEGKMAKVNWARVNKGAAQHLEVRCRLLAYELGYGERLDELFAGTPSLMVVDVLLHQAARDANTMGLMVLDVKRAFLYGRMRRRVYIELLEQDGMAKRGDEVRRLVKVMYSTRYAHRSGHTRCARK